MNILKADIQQFILISALYFVVPLAANAVQVTNDGSKHFDLQKLSQVKSHSPLCEDGGGMQHFSTSIALTESQRDKIFAIQHAQAQVIEDQNQLVRNAYFDLHQLATYGLDNDEDSAKIIESLANARATIALIHSLEEQGIYDLLTAEQRCLLSTIQVRVNDL